LDDRTEALQQDVILMAIATLSMLCGMHFSPYFEPAQILMRPFLASFGLSSPLLLLYMTSLLLALGAVLVGGVPAALFERFTGRVRTDLTSLLVWLGGVVVLAIPVLAGWGR
jgi:hypothetical protein